jgi:hypothetical protein
MSDISGSFAESGDDGIGLMHSPFIWGRVAAAKYFFLSFLL